MKLLHAFEVRHWFPQIWRVFYRNRTKWNWPCFWQPPSPFPHNQNDRSSPSPLLRCLPAQQECFIMKPPALPRVFSSQAFHKALLGRWCVLIMAGKNTEQPFYFQQLVGKQYSKAAQKLQFYFKTQMEELENNLRRGSVYAFSICCTICRSCRIKAHLRIYNANAAVMAQEYK